MAKETRSRLPCAIGRLSSERLRSLAGSPSVRASGRVHEFNVIFDTPDGGLAKHGSCCGFERRHRKDQARGRSSRVVLTFKQPSVRGVDEEGDRFKIREELRSRS